jgi:DNA-binding transcriptional MerR regulator
MELSKNRMAQRQFRIGDLADELNVKKFVIRFWEKEFNIASDRSSGGQRYYTLDDLRVFQTIKDLLYNQGFTIAGAKKQLPISLLHDTAPAVEPIGVAEAVALAESDAGSELAALAGAYSTDSMEREQAAPVADASAVAAEHCEMAEHVAHDAHAIMLAADHDHHDAEVQAPRPCGSCERRDYALALIKEQLLELRARAVRL